MSDSLKHIVVIIPRGEAVRNFVYSDVLPELKKHARVTLFSVVTDPSFLEAYSKYADEIVPIDYVREHIIVRYIRHFLHEAHFRWMWTASARNKWAVRDGDAVGVAGKLRRIFEKLIILPLANRPALEFFTKLENYFTLKFRQTMEFDDLYKRLKPDLVFNGSHIHGDASFLPVRVAHRMGVRTAGFIFSWDNLTNRSRIFEPYDDYIVWNNKMQRQLLDLYPKLTESQICITGTPQFDFHFKDQFVMPREELCSFLGIDPDRKFVLYTTGIDRHFPDEHKHVLTIVDLIQELDEAERPQLVVRTYVKGTSKEMKELAANPPNDVVFPEVQWDERWFTPKPADLNIYTSLVHHACMAINPASTVSLEFLMVDKPVMNIGFDPPGSTIPPYLHWKRHIDRDHYVPVANSGATMIAYSIDDMRQMLRSGLRDPMKQSPERNAFIESMFGNTLDGNSGKRVAGALLKLAGIGSNG